MAPDPFGKVAFVAAAPSEPRGRPRLDGEVVSEGDAEVGCRLEKPGGEVPVLVGRDRHESDPEFVGGGEDASFVARRRHRSQPGADNEAGPLWVGPLWA